MKTKKRIISGPGASSRRSFLKRGAMAGSMALIPWKVMEGENVNFNENSPSFPEGVSPVDPLSDMGLLDITQAPYLADPSGKKDSTQAIQKAVNDARDKGLVCFFPGGTYIISDTISCEQTVEKLDEPKHVDGGTQHYWPVFRPMVLMGSTKGKRPIIRLSKEAKGFDDPAKPKKAIWIWAQTWSDAPGKEEPVWGKEQGNISFSHFFMNIDIDIRGHAGAIGIRHSGSQGSSMMNSTIYAEGAFTGMNNCCGQGGGTYNFEVIGGEFGIWIESDSRFPILNSCIFRGQTKSCVSYYGNSIQVPTMFVGCLFKPKGQTVFDMTTVNSHGGILMIDCMSELENSGTLFSTKKKENIFIENSYVKGADVVDSNGQNIEDRLKWTLIEQFSSHTPQGVNMINGTEQTGDFYTSKPAASAPAYEAVLSLHYRGIPGFEDKDAVNVKTYGAKGDGIADDTEAFRKAIKASDKVFVPKGNFKLSGTIELGPGTQIFGLTRSFSTIGAGGPGRSISGDIDSTSISRMQENELTIITPDDSNAAPGLFLISVRGGRLKWRSGKGIWMLASGSPEFSGKGGGKFYGLGAMGRPLILEGIQQPASFYSLNVERVISNPQSEIKNSSHIRIYYFKVEAGTIQPGSNLIDQDANTPGRISDSEDIVIYCMYGNVKKLGTRPMLDILNSRKIKVCQLKAFTPGDFPHIRETFEGKTFEIPSKKIASLFVRD